MTSPFRNDGHKLDDQKTLKIAQTARFILQRQKSTPKAFKLLLLSSIRANSSTLLDRAFFYGMFSVFRNELITEFKTTLTEIKEFDLSKVTKQDETTLQTRFSHVTKVFALDELMLKHKDSVLSITPSFETEVSHTSNSADEDDKDESSSDDENYSDEENLRQDSEDDHTAVDKGKAVAEDRSSDDVTSDDDISSISLTGIDTAEQHRLIAAFKFQESLMQDANSIAQAGPSTFGLMHLRSVSPTPTELKLQSYSSELQVSDCEIPSEDDLYVDPQEDYIFSIGDGISIAPSLISRATFKRFNAKSKERYLKHHREGFLKQARKKFPLPRGYIGKMEQDANHEKFDKWKQSVIENNKILEKPDYSESDFERDYGNRLNQAALDSYLGIDNSHPPHFVKGCDGCESKRRDRRRYHPAHRARLELQDRRINDSGPFKVHYYS